MLINLRLKFQKKADFTLLLKTSGIYEFFKYFVGVILFYFIYFLTQVEDS